MSNFQSEKRLVRNYYQALDNASPDKTERILTSYTSKDYIWRAYHPFHIQTNAKAVNDIFWKPFLASFQNMQRRMDIFFAGKNFIDDGKSVWVCSMGHLMGLFDNPWLGIQPTNKIAMLRYAEFHKVENEKIAETAFYFDIPHLMIQAGYKPFKNPTGKHLVQPGPATHDGLLFDDAPKEDGKKTMDAMHAMISDLGTWQLGLPLEEELERTWHNDMIWWGPAGIGSSYTIERYAKQHSGPFRAAMTDRSSTGHIARIAEGHYSGFFGWPNFTVKPTGGFMGLPPSDKSCEFRVIDVYRRDGEKLKENWVFIDLLHFFKQQSVDILNNLENYKQ